MGIEERKERHRAERHRAILRAARDLAHDQGWDAVTTRRLADRIEHSQPVLYSHFPGGKDEIVTAVALEGFTELARALRAPGSGTGSRREQVLAAAHAYLGFARDHPAVYDAMFTDHVGLRFAAADTPEPLLAGFAALRLAFTGESGEEESSPGTNEADLLTEVAWAALHGLAALTRAGRLPTATVQARVERFADRFAEP